MAELSTATLRAAPEETDILPLRENYDPGLYRVTLAAIKAFVLDGFTATPSPVATEAGTAADLLTADAGKYIRWTSGSPKTLTVEPESTNPQSADSEWHIRNAGAGDLTIAEGSGVTVNVPAGGTLVLEEGMTVTIKRVAADEYDLLGQTVPV